MYQFGETQNELSVFFYVYVYYTWDTGKSQYPKDHDSSLPMLEWIIKIILNLFLHLITYKDC